MTEVLVHSYDEEPCDAGLDQYEDDTCQHGQRVHWIWVEAAAS